MFPPRSWAGEKEKGVVRILHGQAELNRFKKENLFIFYLWLKKEGQIGG